MSDASRWLETRTGPLDATAAARMTAAIVSILIVLCTLHLLATPTRQRAERIFGVSSLEAVFSADAHAPVGARRETVPPLERFAECGLGFVADLPGHLPDAVTVRSEQMRGFRHTPARQIGQRRLLDQFGEARRKSGSRHPDLGGERFDRPGPLWALMNQAERLSDLRVGQRA